MSGAPLLIWLQFYGDSGPDDLGKVATSETTWCEDQVFDSDIRYIRADQTERQQAVVDAARSLCARQAEDEGLWFRAKTASEAYLQNALRKLHAVIEGDGTRSTDVPQSGTLEE